MSGALRHSCVKELEVVEGRHPIQFFRYDKREPGECISITNHRGATETRAMALSLSCEHPAQKSGRE